MTMCISARSGHFKSTTHGPGIFKDREAMLEITLRYSTRFGAGGLGLKVHQGGKTRSMTFYS